MSEGKYFHIYIKRNPSITKEQEEEKLNLAIDWFRYESGIYIVYSTSTPKVWQGRLKPFVHPDGYLFICELNTSNYNGWMTKSFWEWYNKKRPEQK